MPHGPLPQWELIGGFGSDTYEAVDPDGMTWRLWLVEQPNAEDPLPPGYRLAPRDNPTDPTYITAAGGLYHALDLAGLRIAGTAVRSDPDGARQQLELGAPPSHHAGDTHGQATTAVNDGLAQLFRKLGPPTDHTTEK
ncbi:hypothetical protein [Streptomyces lydicus]|uniref:hypothetical protein n=1 Tax=Streptomyces lydicus TaxID=47763 RepID=UPI0037A068EF